MAMSGQGRHWHRLAIKFERYPGETRTAPYAALFLRLVLSWFFLAHLYSKYFTRGGFHTWWDALRQHYPAYVPIYVLTVEFAAVLLLPLGIRTRWVSLYAMPAMLGVVQFWMKSKGYWFTTPGAEFPIMWLCLLVLQAILADGAYAVKISRARAAGI
jgi:putative oxidoreductase